MTICPQAKFNTVKNVLIELKKVQHPLSTVELKKVTSSLYNSIPVMKEFFFIIRTHEGFKLTENGLNFASLLIEGDKNKIREYAKNNLLTRSKIFSEAYKILTETPNIDNEQLGRKLNEKFRKKEWIDERTYKAVGKSCKDILDGFNLYEYKERKKGRGGGKHRKRHTDKLFTYTSAEIIFKLLDESFIDNTWKATQDEFKDSKNIKRILYANTLLDIGIGKYIDNVNNIIELTEDGKNLKNASGSIRQNIFQDILLKHPPIRDILKIIINNNYEEINQDIVGDILEKYNKVHWTQSTKVSYAVKLLNWLKESLIIEEIEWGKYRLSPFFLEKYKDILTEEKQMIITDSTEMKIDIIQPDTEKIIGNIHTYCNRILHSEKKEWYNNVELREKILSNIESLIEIYKSKKQGTRSLEHMRDWIITGFKLKDKKNIENCLQILVDDIL